ncbi:MAG: CsbD family protein [Tepidisphaeraceae bacterium]|jgi:hypothetical protein
MDPKRPLSEISHLFLSELRARQPAGSRPTRIGPKPVDVSPEGFASGVDMTPEEFAASPEPGPMAPEAEPASAPATSIPHSGHISASVVLSSHLIDHPGQSVRQYARYLAAEAKHVGLIETDGAELMLSCFELNGGGAELPVSIEGLDGRKLSETLTELAVDVDRWLISLPHARTPEAREMLRTAPHWVLLSTADHEGVVATYRALKGLSDLGRHRISLVVLDARDDAHADAIFRKLDAVSRQFLHCGLEAGSPLRPVQNVTEHAVLSCRAEGKASAAEGKASAAEGKASAAEGKASAAEGKASAQAAEQSGPASAEHWQIIRQFLTSAVAPKPQHHIQESQPMKLNTTETARMSVVDDSIPEVIELPAEANERSILDAVVRQGGADGRWVLCPIHPPMCPDALLAVGRDQRLMLLAVAGRGLGQLMSIGQAFRWMTENTELIRMALPQLAIDASATPCVRVLVDHNDLAADVLQPLLQSGTVTVQAYRRVKWGRKAGLLVEAA